MRLALAFFVATLIAVAIGVTLIAASQGAFDGREAECGSMAACAPE